MRTARAVHTYVSGLRRVLGNLIIGEGSSYRLRPDAAVDASIFAQLVESAVRLQAEDPHAALDLCGRALKLWGGEPFVDLADVGGRPAEAARLEEFRTTAIVLRAQISIDFGRPLDALADLASLVRERPFRDDVVELQMVALIAVGAPTGAIHAYEAFRRMIEIELMAEPSMRLQRLAGETRAQLASSGLGALFDNAHLKPTPPPATTSGAPR